MDWGVPVVSGISPREGPPGTKVTLRGEFLGMNKQDIISKNVYCMQIYRAPVSIFIHNPTCTKHPNYVMCMWEIRNPVCRAVVA